MLLTASDMDPACEASDSLWLIWSVWSPLMNWDGAISMSKCLHGMVWVSIQEHNSSATVCHVHHPGLILFGILEGAPLFLCDIISQWLGHLDTGSNSSPEVLDSLCIRYSDFCRDLGEYTWLRWWLEFQQDRPLFMRGHLRAAGGVNNA